MRLLADRAVDSTQSLTSLPRLVWSEMLRVLLTCGEVAVGGVRRSTTRRLLKRVISCGDRAGTGR